MTGILRPYWLYKHGACPPQSASAGTVETNIMQSSGTQACAAAVSFDSITNNDYVITLTRLEELRREAEEYDRPSDYAFAGALRVLEEAARELSLGFPRASASVGPNQGLRVTWSSGLGEVRLIIGGKPENKSYIYSESGLAHGVDYNLDGRHLAGYLRWVLREA